MTTHCSQGAKAKIEYSFNGQKQIYETVGAANVTTASEGNNTPLLKFGSTATVPSDWESADVYLYGIWYSSPAGTPNCPHEYLELFIGQASPGQVLTAVATPRFNVCDNAHTIAISQMNYSDTGRQWQGSDVGIGLKNNIACSIQIINSEGFIFTRSGECPINYEVSCGDDCPEGSHKCTHNKYPGYCCVPCKETGTRLKNMANKVGR